MQLETRAFLARLTRSDLEQARILWELFAEMKVVLTAFHAAGAMRAVTGEVCRGPDEIETFVLTRLRSILERVESIALSDDAGRRLFATALRDLIVAAGRANRADIGERFVTATVAYDAGRVMAERLWALELAPEGAPLAKCVRTDFVA